MNRRGFLAFGTAAGLLKACAPVNYGFGFDANRDGQLDKVDPLSRGRSTRITPEHEPHLPPLNIEFDPYGFNVAVNAGFRPDRLYYFASIASGNMHLCRQIDGTATLYQNIFPHQLFPRREQYPGKVEVPFQGGSRWADAPNVFAIDTRTCGLVARIG